MISGTRVAVFTDRPLHTPLGILLEGHPLFLDSWISIPPHPPGCIFFMSSPQIWTTRRLASVRPHSHAPLCSGKRVIRAFHHCAIIECSYTDLDGTAYCTPRLYTKQHETKSNTRNDAIVRHGKRKVYEAAAGVTWYTFCSKLFLNIQRLHSKIMQKKV